MTVPTEHRPRRRRVVTIWASYGPYHLARVNGLQRAGFDVAPFSYATTDPTYPFFREKPPGLIVLNDLPVGRVNPILSFVHTLRALLEAAPDLVLTCGYERPESLAAVAYCRLVARSMRRPQARCVLMADNVERPHRRVLIEVAKSLYLRAFDGFLVGGRKHIDYFSTLGVSSEKVAIGYDCVDNDRIARLVRDFRQYGSRPLSAPYLLTVSRLIDRKNTQSIVRALSIYARDLPVGARPFHLVVAGDGPLRRHLEELSATLDVANLVHFTGELGELKEVTLYYAFASAFILASSFDEWGLVINEAMAAGLPIVAATQVGAAPDLVAEGINGFTFDANSHSDLAVLLRRLHDMRPSLPALGKASRSIIDRYSPDVFAANAASFLNA